MHTLLNISLTIVFTAIMGFGQIILSLASKDIFSGGFFSIRNCIESRFLWFGLVLYAIAMVLWLFILSRFDVKYAYPISTLAVFFAAVFQSQIEKSPLPGNYWLGLIIVITGLVILKSQ